MGNSEAALKLQKNKPAPALKGLFEHESEFGEQNQASELEQRYNSQGVFQKEIFKKSINQINNKLIQMEKQNKLGVNSQNVNRKFKSKSKFTQTLFVKQKLKKISNKVIEEQFIRSCDSIQSQQSTYSLSNPSQYNEGPQFKSIMISQEMVLKVKNMRIEQKYYLGEIIGEGGFGVVYRGECLTTHQLRAIKVLQFRKFSQFQRQLILNEIAVISRLDHPNIIKIYQIFQYHSTYYIVTEYCDGGSLSEYLKNQRPANANAELFAKSVMYKLLSALKYIHSKNIIHRDIKLQNLVFKKVEVNGKQQMVIKLIDFGLAVELKGQRMFRSQQVIGTPQYLPPESIKGVHYAKSDVWSCGVILYFLLQGQYPFKGSSKTQIISKIRRNSINLKCSKWDCFTKEVKQLLGKMLTSNHEQRISSQLGLSHAWFKQYERKQLKLSIKTCRKSAEIALQLLNFERCNNLITYLDSYTILTKLDEEEREKLIYYFNLIDKNHNGVIEIDELNDYLTKNNFHLPKQEIESAFKKLDLNSSESIYLNQFIYALTNVDKYYEPSHIEQIFRLIDRNSDGYVDKKQLKLVLNDCKKEQIQFLMNTIGKKIKNQFNFDEFKHYIKSAKRRKSKIYL